jgi:hypothetical protein
MNPGGHSVHPDPDGHSVHPDPGGVGGPPEGTCRVANSRKRDLLQCQKRPITVSNETYYMLQSRQLALRSQD